MTQTVVQLRGPVISVPKGTRLNDIYEIEDQIAAGGMGEIYRGKQIETGYPVAIKMIKPEFAGNESVLALFRKEALALNDLHHDSIVRYYVFTTDPKLGRPYLAMEFVEGVALSDILRDRPLTFEETEHLRKRVASGLQAAHNKGIVHRDMSPDNIILPEGDVKQAKIIDFGIAKSSKMGQATVIGDGFAGKYNYVSPEQLGMFGGEITNRSDIYSLGLVLAQSLLGQPLDMSGTQADVVQKRFKVPDLSQIDRHIRPLLEKMLQPDPANRPESMAAVADWSPAAQKSASGSRMPLIGGGIAAALAAVGAGSWMMLSQPKPAQQPEQTALVTPKPPVTEPVKRTAPLTAAERGQRVLDYLRYYDGGDCFYIAPQTVADKAASLTTYSDFIQSVSSFQADFKTVNGFEPKVNDVRISRAQCEIVPFLFRLDPQPDTGFTISLKQSSLRHGEKIQANINGLADRKLELILINEDGTVRNLTSMLSAANGPALDAILDDKDSAPQAQKLLVALASPKPGATLPDAASLPPGVFLDAAATDLLRLGGKNAVALQMISYK